MYGQFEEEVKVIPLDKSSVEVKQDRVTFTVNKVEKKKIENFVTAQKAFDNNLRNLDKYKRRKTEKDFGGIGKIVHNSINKEYANKKFINTHLPGPVAAIAYAFMNHQHLTLSPSDFIILIGQGLATHINQNGEKLRKEFVDHEGKQLIKIKVDKIDFADEEFSKFVFDEFAKEINKRVKKEIHDVIIDDTSVATHTTKIVSQLNLMDSMKTYFEYMMQCICGFPKITLLGTPDDWQKLKNKVHKLNEMNGKEDKLELNWWLKNLVPVVDKICESAISRKIDVEFWSNMYQQSSRYGGNDIKGWFNAFLPFNHEDKKNYSLEGGIQEGFVYSSGIDPKDIKEGISEVPFKIQMGFG